MKKISFIFSLFSILCICAGGANAMPYVAQHSGGASASDESELPSSESFAQRRRFYVGGDYNFSIWQSDIDAAQRFQGKTAGSFDVMAGVRLYDIFRVEANYYQTRANWDGVSLSGNAAFINAIFDGRIDSPYQFFRRQYFVPYVGLGVGMSWNTSDGADINKEKSFAMAALAGLAVEFNDTFALDFGYRYLYMAAPEFEMPGGTAKHFAPVAHQIRAGARISF
ncbi:hypothetical protein FACS189421_08610 [Bacteroidia bacterium]|nr:hypothetical protein FACS189421_08610 [Bacteroidia bacterium]